MGNSLRMQIYKKHNKLYKVAPKDAMNVELGLKKIAPLELDKKNLIVNLFDATELLNNVKTESMLLLEKVKKLEHELYVAREQNWLRFCRKHLCVCTTFHKLCSFFFFQTPCE